MLVHLRHRRHGFGRRMVRWCSSSIVLLTVGSAAAPARADNGPSAGALRFERVRGSDELRDPRIVAIVRDPDGFMWFATFSGLVRYDGYEFRWFVHDPDDESTLSDNRVRGLLSDSDGALWASTWDDGLNRLEPRTGRLTRYRHDPLRADSLDDDRIRALYEDRKGSLWVGTRTGLNRLDRRTGRVVRYPQLTTHKGQVYSVEALIEDELGHLWVGAYGWGLLRVSSNGQLLASYRHDPARPDSLSDNRVTSLAIDGRGTLWVGTWGGGLDAFNQEAGTFRAYRHDPADDQSIPDDQLLKIWSDRHGVWVIPLVGPLARLDQVTRRFVRYPHDERRVGSPNLHLSGAAFADPQGSLWIGTYGDGVDVWHPAKPLLTHYREAPGTAGGLSDNLVLAALQDRRGGLWLGTRRGLDRLDASTGQVTSYQHEPANPNSLSADYVAALYEDRDGVLWVGTWGGGLNRFDPQRETFRRYPCGTSDPQALSDCDVWSIFEDQSGRLWIGTYDGLARLDRERQRLTQYTSRPEDPSSLSAGTITSITATPDGTLWVGTNNGFDRWVPQSETFVRYTYSPSDPTGLVHQTVNIVRARPDGSLWLGTGAGLQLVEWDKTGAPRYTLYAERVGLPRFNVQGLLIDGSGTLWIMTLGHGLWKFDPASDRAARFDSSDGLLKAYDGPGGMMSDGRLLLGGIDGVVIFDPSSVATPSRPPPIAITAVRVDNQPVPGMDTIPQRAEDATPRVILSPANRLITFKFSVLDYYAPGRNRYRYRLEGFDDDWIDAAATDRIATYTNLPSGTYRFRVSGANAIGAWNEPGVSVQLTVQPPWWRTAWFNVLSVMVFFGVVVLAHRLRLKYVVDANRRLIAEVEQRREAETQIQDLAGRLITAQETERSYIARDLHDDIGQRVASLSIGLSRVKRQIPAGTDGALESLSGLQDQAKQLSGDLRRLSHDLHPSALEHLGLLRALRTRCREFGEETGLSMQLEIDETSIDAPDALALCLYRVAQEGLRNVATHARATHVTVSLAHVDGHLIMTIADDGRGFDPASSSIREGLGLISMRERVRSLGGAVAFVTAPGKGTKLSVRLPIGGRDASQDTSR